jgi:hypothetical protein
MELENELSKLKTNTTINNLARTNGYFTRNQLQRWDLLLTKIPEQSHVYIKAGIGQLRETYDKYHEWLGTNQKKQTVIGAPKVNL